MYQSNRIKMFQLEYVYIEINKLHKYIHRIFKLQLTLFESNIHTISRRLLT